jgi:thiamine-phosphate pyrophosphorylase
VPENSTRVAGLYAVTPDEPDTARLLAGVEAALAGGASALQYRHKSADARLRLEQGRALLALCRRYRRPLIINDHLELALELDADGLHLGVDDGDLARARGRLGTGRILGASCYDRLENAIEAQRAGATYVAFGSFFASTVKPGAVRAPLALLGAARKRLSVPVIAIGGITLDNAPRLIEAGADGVAVISAVFGAPDIEAAARDFTALFGAIIRRA